MTVNFTLFAHFHLTNFNEHHKIETVFISYGQTFPAEMVGGKKVMHFFGAAFFAQVSVH